MKKQISLIVAGLLFSTVAVFANQMPASSSTVIVSIKPSSDPTSLELRLANLEKKGTFIELQDVKGNTWYSQHVWRKHGYAKKLNLKGMPDGGYLLSIRHKDATVVQMLTLSKGVLSLQQHQKIEVPNEPREDLAKD